MVIDKNERLYKEIEKFIVHGDFILSSGKSSNKYIDLKLACSDTYLLRLITDEICNRVDIDNIDCIGGMELGAVPIIVSTALRLHLNYFIVRKNIKGHGTKKEYEGYRFRDKKILLLEDVITTGNSMNRCIDIVHKYGGIITNIISIVDRGNYEYNNYECLMKF